MIRDVRGQFSSLVTPVAGGPAKSSDTDDTAGPHTLPALFDEDKGVLLLCLKVLWPRLKTSEVSASDLQRHDIEVMLQSHYGYGSVDSRELVSGFLVLHERFHGHWGVVSEAVARRWRRLDSQDLAEVTGTVSEVVALLAEKYPISQRQVRSELMSLLESLHFAELLRLSTGRTQVTRSPGPRSESQQKNG